MLSHVTAVGSLLALTSFAPPSLYNSLCHHTQTATQPLSAYAFSGLPGLALPLGMRLSRRHGFRQELGKFLE